MTRDNYAALQSKIEKEISRLQKQALALQTKRRSPVIRDIVRLMRQYEITPDEINAAFNKKGRKPAARPAARKAEGPAAAKPVRTVPPKYRNPATGDTWTGRGKPPRWIAQAEADGKKRDDFLIKAA